MSRQCRDCGVPMAPRTRGRSLPAGHRRHGAGGRCNACYGQLPERKAGKAGHGQRGPVRPPELFLTGGNVPEAWVDQALCRLPEYDPDQWFPDSNLDGVAAARATCGACPVREACLTHALRTGEMHGIWGGALPAARSRMLRWVKVGAA